VYVMKRLATDPDAYLKVAIPEPVGVR